MTEPDHANLQGARGLHGLRAIGIQSRQGAMARGGAEVRHCFRRREIVPSSRIQAEV